MIDKGHSYLVVTRGAEVKVRELKEFPKDSKKPCVAKDKGTYIDFRHASHERYGCWNAREAFGVFGQGA